MSLGARSPPGTTSATSPRLVRGFAVGAVAGRGRAGLDRCDLVPGLDPLAPTPSPTTSAHAMVFRVPARVHRLRHRKHRPRRRDRSPVHRASVLGLRGRGGVGRPSFRRPTILGPRRTAYVGVADPREPPAPPIPCTWRCHANPSMPPRCPTRHRPRCSCTHEDFRPPTGSSCTSKPSSLPRPEREATEPSSPSGSSKPRWPSAMRRALGSAPHRATSGSSCTSRWSNLSPHSFSIFS